MLKYEKHQKIKFGFNAWKQIFEKFFKAQFA